MSFFARLEARCRATGSLLCVGLDPHVADLAEPTAESARAFCLRLIRATLPHAAAFKPNAAFFEALGPEGVGVLREVIAAIPDEVPVILDAKRGDIASTAEAYAVACFDVLGADAVTLHGYLGAESVTPFTKNPERGVFVLARTSNPGAGEIQDLLVTGADGTTARLFEVVAERACGWSEHDNVGLVVGATRPDDVAAVRARVPSAWILAPGVGAQGGDLAATVRAGRRADGLGILVNASRGLSRSADPGSAAAELVAQMRAVPPSEPARALDPLASGLLRAGCVKFGSFTLKSGLTSPIYLDLRRLVGDPALLGLVARAYGRLLRGLTYDVVAALPYAALPIGTAVSLHTGDPLVYPRREVKAYGTKAAVEGVFQPGQVAVVLDDLATTGDSKVEGIDKLREVGLSVTDVVVLIDRESGAREAMAAIGVRMHAVFTMTELLDAWEAGGAVPAAQADEARAFVAATRPT
jgi:uridine monophosphate synthetase